MARWTIARLFRTACLLMIFFVAVGGTSSAGSTVPLPATKYPKTELGETQCWSDGLTSISDAQKADRITVEIWLASLMGIGVVCGQLSTAHSAVWASAAMVNSINPNNSMDDLVKKAEPLFWKSYAAAPWLYKPITQPTTGQ